MYLGKDYTKIKMFSYLPSSSFFNFFLFFSGTVSNTLSFKLISNEFDHALPKTYQLFCLFLFGDPIVLINHCTALQQCFVWPLFGLSVIFKTQRQYMRLWGGSYKYK